MPSIAVTGFGGLLPVMNPQALANENAQVARNARLEGADLEAWKAPLQITALTSGTPVLSIYRFNILSASETEFWFQWVTDVNVVKGPIAGDTEERTYWTGDGAYPKKTKSDIATVTPPYPTNHYRLGIPAPTAAPTVVISGTATDPDSDADTATWGFTYVTSWDEEGPMSPLSALNTWRPGQTPQISGLGSAPPSGPYTIDRKRLYRSNTGNGSTDLQFVMELAITVASVDDTVESSALGAISATRYWTPPPDGIKGLCLMANEIMCAFFENTVRFSEPGVPYAWPERYSYSFGAPVVAIVPFAQSLLVLTARSVHVLTGTDPGFMAQEDVKKAGVCLSKRGAVAFGEGVAYPVKLGLQYVGPDGAYLLTEGAFDEIKWSAYAPSSFTAAVVNGRYIASYDTGAVTGSLVFTFGRPSVVVESTEFGTALWTEEGTDRLYMVQSNNVRRWDGGSALTYIWRSKLFRVAKPACFARARVEADTYPVTLRVYAGGTLRHTQVVADKYAFTLAGGNVESLWEFELEGTSRLTAVVLATSMDELKKV
jgi:hypothetical protein